MLSDSKSILIFEDNNERMAAFQKPVAALGDGFDFKVLRDVKVRSGVQVDPNVHAGLCFIGRRP